MAERARIYLDVDGVINSLGLKPYSHPSWGWTEHRTERANGYWITWAPELIEVLKRLAARPEIEMFWLTTWCHDAPKLLAPVLGLDHVDWMVVGHHHWERAAPTVWWKHAAIVEHLADFDGPVLWIDDDHGYYSACEAWLQEHPQVRAVRPNSYLGVTRAEAEAIEMWADLVCPQEGSSDE